MFGGSQANSDCAPSQSNPPQLSAEEIRAGEVEAAFTIKLALAGALSLYISPFIVDGIFKLI